MTSVNQSRLTRSGATASASIDPTTGFRRDPLPTPSRFLAEGAGFNFTPGLMTSMATVNESNPFEASFNPPAAVVGDSRSKRQKTSADGSAAASMDRTAEVVNRNYDAGSGRVPDGPPQNVEVEGDTQQKSKRKASTDSGDDADQMPMVEGEDEEKREEFLQKNRLAASKCRQKKKQWIQELEKRSDEAAKRNEELSITVSKLQEELMTLKSKLLAHRDCDCGMIQKYIHSSGQFSYAADDALSRGQ